MIVDFTAGSDVIDLRRFSTIEDFPDLTLSADTGGVSIDLGAHGGGSILVQGANVDNLSLDDFLFYGWVYGTNDEFGDNLHGNAGRRLNRQARWPGRHSWSRRQRPHPRRCGR